MNNNLAYDQGSISGEHELFSKFERQLATILEKKGIHVTSHTK